MTEKDFVFAWVLAARAGGLQYEHQPDESMTKVITYASRVFNYISNNVNPKEEANATDSRATD